MSPETNFASFFNFDYLWLGLWTSDRVDNGLIGLNGSKYIGLRVFNC